MPTIDQTNVHGSAVAVGGRAALIVGPSGSGKSSLALDLMSRGAALVSDDRTMVRRSDDELYVSAPGNVGGMIEARGIGILNADALDQAKLEVIVDLSCKETSRLPPVRSAELLGLEVTVVYGAEQPGLAPGLAQLLKSGRRV